MCADAPPQNDVAAEESPQSRAPSALIRLLGRLERSTGLDPVVRGVEPFATRIVAHQRLRRVLHGGCHRNPAAHHLHRPALGAWWMAQFLDLFPTMACGGPRPVSSAWGWWLLADGADRLGRVGAGGPRHPAGGDRPRHGERRRDARLPRFVEGSVTPST